MKFTFQSGDIQISVWINDYDLTEEFTFQSGDIQIKISFLTYALQPIHLHSNLVIFKFTSFVRKSIYYDSFTFQSGDIQIAPFGLLTDKFNRIYIPIW